MAEGSSRSAEGLRSRKKRETRQTISKAAAALFKSRGYENVRMKDIAIAADVSEQTLYNYYPSKEHLIFDQQQEFQARIVSTVIGRSSMISLSEALRQSASQLLTELSQAVGKQKGIPPSVAAGYQLRRVWIEMNARHSDALTDALLETGWTRDRPTAKFVARSVVAFFASIFEGVGEAAIAGRPSLSILQELQTSIDSMSSLVEKGFGD